MTNTPGYSELVGAELRRERERAGLTLVKAAEKAGMHPDSLSRLETGRRSVNVDDLVTLTLAYGASPWGLMQDALYQAVRDQGQIPSENTYDAEFMERLAESLPQVRAAGFTPSWAMIKEMQLAAVQTLPPIDVRMTFGATVVKAQTLIEKYAEMAPKRGLDPNPRQSELDNVIAKHGVSNLAELLETWETEDAERG